MLLYEKLLLMTFSTTLVALAVCRKENSWAAEHHLLVFLFLGSAGAGKTELAKQLAECSHKKEDNALICIDTSEY
jgi:ATP-dependent Clp protease ATP-binding subunit ClpA